MLALMHAASSEGAPTLFLLLSIIISGSKHIKYICVSAPLCLSLSESNMSIVYTMHSVFVVVVVYYKCCRCRSI